MRNFSYLYTLVFLLSLVIALSYCARKENNTSTELVFLNHADTVDYVGIETCRQCHADVHATFVETGMGSSFGPASRLLLPARCQETGQAAK